MMKECGRILLHDQLADKGRFHSEKKLSGFSYKLNSFQSMGY